MAYQDFRAYLNHLESIGKLRRVECEVEKEWEIAALCREILYRYSPQERFGLFFSRVKGHQMPLVAGVLGVSREFYGLALGVSSRREVVEKWLNALKRPLDPVLVESGPCQEVITQGEEVNLGELPVPVWTAGLDPGPYLTSPYIITKDPETGIGNVGTYRVQVKDRNRLGTFIERHHHAADHLRKYEEMGKPMPVAIVLGADPAVGLCSVTNIPAQTDELAVAGALRGEPLEVVKARTNDLLVPARAEIVIEGEIPPAYRELEGPFGEYTGYMGPPGLQPLIKVNCVTRRRDAIYQAFISQMPPSESTLIRGIGHEVNLLHHLRDVLGLPVKDVCLRESGGGAAYLVISMRKERESQPRQAIWAAWGYHAGNGKVTIVVDDDIDVHNDFQVDWAVSFRSQPERDVFILNSTQAVALDPSVGEADIPQHEKGRKLASKMGIDATKKHEFPALALPPQEHLQKIAANWSKYGLS